MSDGKAPPYDTIRQAYEHLMKYEDRQPYEYREDDNWAVVYFDRTLIVRLFPTLEMIGKVYSWSIYRANVFVNPEQLAIKFTGVRLVEVYNHLRHVVSKKSGEQLVEPLGDEWSNEPLKVAKMVWDQFQIMGNRVTRVGQGNAMNSQDSDKYQIRVDLLKDPANADELASCTKQCRVIAQALADEEKTTYTEKELTSFARQLSISGKLKTKQDPLRVVKYYCPQLADLGFMSYPTKRNNDAGEE